jgi:hypothetical protein
VVQIQYNIYILDAIYVTLWLFNIAMENGPFIDGLPNLKMVIFHGYVIHNQRVIPTNI